MASKGKLRFTFGWTQKSTMFRGLTNLTTNYGCEYKWCQLYVSCTRFCRCVLRWMQAAGGVKPPTPFSPFSKRNRCELSEVKIWTAVNIKLAQTASHHTSGTVFQIYFKRKNRHCTKWPHLRIKKNSSFFSTCVQCRIKDLLWSQFCFMLRT